MLKLQAERIGYRIGSVSFSTKKTGLALAQRAFDSWSRYIRSNFASFGVRPLSRLRSGAARKILPGKGCPVVSWHAQPYGPL